MDENPSKLMVMAAIGWNVKSELYFYVEETQHVKGMFVQTLSTYSALSYKQIQIKFVSLDTMQRSANVFQLQMNIDIFMNVMTDIG